MVMVMNRANHRPARATHTPEKDKTRGARAFSPCAPTTPPAMNLYNLTVQPPTATPHALVGNFSGAGAQESLPMARDWRC